MPTLELLHRRVVVSLRKLDSAQRHRLALLRRRAARRERGLGHVEAGVPSATAGASPPSRIRPAASCVCPVHAWMACVPSARVPNYLLEERVSQPPEALQQRHGQRSIWLTWPGHRHANQHHISADQWTCAARAHRRASSWALWLFENSSATSDAMTAQKGSRHSPHVTECRESARPTRGMRAAEEMRNSVASAAPKRFFSHPSTFCTYPKWKPPGVALSMRSWL